MAKVEFIFRPVFCESKKLLRMTRKRYEFDHMEPYAAIIGQQGHKSELGEYKAKTFKVIPYAICRLDYRDFENYCKNIEITDDSDGLVPDSTFFCLDEDRNNGGILENEIEVEGVRKQRYWIDITG